MISALRSACAGLVLLCAGSAQAALLGSYDFDGSLADSLGNGAALATIADADGKAGTVENGRYAFGENQGLRLGGFGSAYAIELGFKVKAGEEVGYYNKVLDFTNLGADAGLYIYQNALKLFNIGSPGGVVTADTDLFLGIVRTAGNAVNVYLGTEALSATSTPVITIANAGEWGNPVNGLVYFFRDDRSVGGETFAGSADFIRVHDDASTFGSAPVPQPAPVPVPAALPLLAAGLGALGIFGAPRRRSR